MKDWNNIWRDGERSHAWAVQGHVTFITNPYKHETREWMVWQNGYNYAMAMHRRLHPSPQQQIRTFEQGPTPAK